MTFKTILITSFLTMFANNALANEQIITPSPAVLHATSTETIAISLNYTNNRGSRLTGLGLRVHYDSSKLSFDPNSPILTESLQPISSPQDDREDFDSDPSTDKYIILAWVDINGNWPNADFPANLGELIFTLNDHFSGSTWVRFSSSSSAAGFSFTSKSAQIQSAESNNW